MMKRLIATGIFILLFALCIFPPYTHAQAPDPGRVFLETFDGKPASPEPFSQRGQNDWDIQIHSRNNDTWDTLVPVPHAHHGSNCEPPLTSSATAPYSQSEIVSHYFDGTYENAVYKCADHVMTSIYGIGRAVHDGYGLITMTPNHMVDFTDQEAVIRWDVTTFRTTQRDWIDIWITPWEDNLTLPFDQGDVDLQGEPRNTVKITMFAPNNNSKTGLKPGIVINGSNTGEFEPFSDDYNWFTGYEDYLPGNAGDPKRRDTFELRISKNHISICMPQDTSDNAPSQTICWASKSIRTLPFTKGIVQFAHHSYTPDKDCSFYAPLICGPDTWHWDNVYIAPAIPFTMIKADKRMVRNESEVVTFNQPAPANARLRFSATGSVQVSFNDGPFNQVTKQFGTNPSNGHTASYFVNVPQGTQTVRFRMSDIGEKVHAKDFAIWAQGTSGEPQPTMTPTLTPTPQGPTSTPAPTLPPDPTGLVAAYGFAENSGQTAMDETTNHPGILTGTQWNGSGKFDSALRFDGSSSMSTGVWDIPGFNMSLMAWVYPTAASGDYRIISKATGSQEQEHYWMLSMVNGNQLRFRLKTNGTTSTLIGGNIPTNTWTHVAAIYNGSAMTLYVNGSPVASQNKTGQITGHASSPVLIGSNPDNYAGFVGDIDEVRIYQRALPAEEILSVMNTPVHVHQSNKPGDVNQDGSVNLQDISIVLSHFGMQNALWIDGDMDGNTIVGVSDLAQVFANFGQ